MEYDIFVVNHADDEFQPNAVHIYEPKTASWRTTSAIPERLNFVCADRKRCPMSIVLKNEIYALFRPNEGLPASLASYNKVTGVVSELGIEVPCIDDDHDDSLQLVVSEGRLFCVKMERGILIMEGVMSEKCDVDIVEFILARQECIKLSELPAELLSWVLGDDFYRGDVWNEPEEPFIATACANSILLYSFVGRSLAYDLSNGTWHKYPDNSLSEAQKQFREDYQELYGSNHCLSLCAP